MTYLLLAIVVAVLAYQAGRISPDPMRRWEVILRGRAIEWRISLIDDAIRRAELRRAEMVAWLEKVG